MPRRRRSRYAFYRRARLLQEALQRLAGLLRASAVCSVQIDGPILAGATVVFMPTVVVFLFMQRFFLRGVLQGSLKGPWCSPSVALMAGPPTPQ